MTSHTAKIMMVGPFPPPVHGVSTTNAAIRERLRCRGVNTVVINTSAAGLDRSLLARFGRLPWVLRGLYRLLRMSELRGATMYISIAGGLGQLYDILFLFLARVHRMRIYMRHCSFAYLDRASLLARALVKIGGPSAVHITQSHRMAERLTERYEASRVVPISNAVLYLQDTAVVRHRQRMSTLGFLSNLSAEKGVFDFLELMTRIHAKRLPIKAKLAGPFQDHDTEQVVRSRLESLRCVDYVGPVYGEDKERFLAGIDVFIFPTRYQNETEAKVNHEAMSRGIPVIAYGRGCIPEIIGSDCGLIIEPADPFVPGALEQIKLWLDDPATFNAASKGAAARFGKTYAESKGRWEALLNEISGGAGAPSRSRQGICNRKPDHESS